MHRRSTELDSLIRRADQADGAAGDELFALLYAELHRLAEATLRRNGGPPSLGTTTLVHEAYLNVAGRDGVAFVDHGRFLAYAARAMRGLVIDDARRRCAVRRGRQLEITLGDDEGPSGDAVVDMHFFGGFSLDEIAAVRDVSERTVQRDWRKARALLHQALLDEGLEDDGVA